MLNQGAPRRETVDPPSLARQSLGWRVFEITSIGLAVLLAAAFMWFALDVLLLLFAAALLAAVLRAPTDALARLGVPDRLALALVVVVVLAFLVGLGRALAPQVVSQLPQLVESLADTITQVQRDLGLEEGAEQVAENFNLEQMLPSTAGLVGGATGLIASTFGAMANLVILVVVGIYLAASPSLYVDGITRLVPQHKRERVQDTLRAIGLTLRWWMIGQLISMTVVGVLSYIGLRLLGVPLALVLALIAFLLTFIPFLGPILSAIPVVLVATSQGFETALYTLALYALIQSLEGYVLTPMVQRRTVALPPALTVSAQVLLGVLAGAIGVVLATPVAAAGLVAVKMLYIEAVLGEETDVEVPEGASEEAAGDAAAGEP